jgi:rRNA maturation protein Nop10
MEKSMRPLSNQCQQKTFKRELVSLTMDRTNWPFPTMFSFGDKVQKYLELVRQVVLRSLKLQTAAFVRPRGH